MKTTIPKKRLMTGMGTSCIIQFHYDYTPLRRGTQAWVMAFGRRIAGWTRRANVAAKPRAVFQFPISNPQSPAADRPAAFDFQKFSRKSPRAVVNREKGDYTGEQPKGLPIGRISMPKALCIVGTAVTVLLLLAFGLDLAVEFPFHRASAIMDVGFLVCSLILGYLSWMTLREQK